MGVNGDEISFGSHYTIEKCRKIDNLHFIQLSTLGFHRHGEKDLKCDIHSQLVLKCLERINQV